MSVELVKYDAARRALEEARSVDEVKDIRDKAASLAAYAKQAGDLKMWFWAAEIKLRAERKAGALLKEMQESGERASPGGDRASSHDARLADLGVKYDQSSRWQQEAEVPEEYFEAWVEEHRTREEAVPTSAGLRSLAKRLQNEAVPAVALPEGRYSTIVIDPPWPMQKVSREVRPNQEAEVDYPTMSLEDIGDFDVSAFAADSAHLFLWTTQRFLPASFGILNGWGFKYVCEMVWHKPGGFQPYGLPQYNCEFALYGRKGSPSFETTKDFFTCFTGERREHSRKPVEFYKLIERVCPDPRIDIFSREDHDGFDKWGNQPDEFVE